MASLALFHRGTGGSGYTTIYQKEEGDWLPAGGIINVKLILKDLAFQGFYEKVNAQAQRSCRRPKQWHIITHKTTSGIIICVILIRIFVWWHSTRKTKRTPESLLIELNQKCRTCCSDPLNSLTWHTRAWSVRFGFCPSRLSADSILSSSLINSSAWPAVFRQR